jgi:branched-chain amino acid aminotransferase
MTTPERTIWMDGRLVPWGEANVHVLSQSIQRGSLVFDVMPCYSTPRGVLVLGLREHTERFCRSAELLAMDLPLDLEGILQAISETVRANPGSDMVKISAFNAGFSLDVLPSDAHPSIAIAAFGFLDVLPPGTELMVRPVRLQLADSVKMPPTVISPQAKVAAGYTAASVAKARARRDGFDDILFLDAEGNIAESSTQSCMLVRGGEIHVPPLDYVLSGITRRATLELAEDEGIAVRVAPIPRSALDEAEEVFLTGTTINVCPVERIDDRKFGAGAPGPVTARLRERFEKMVRDEDPVFSPRWLQPV